MPKIVTKLTDWIIRFGKRRVELDTDVWSRANEVANHDDDGQLDRFDLGLGYGAGWVAARARHQSTVTGMGSIRIRSLEISYLIISRYYEQKLIIYPKIHILRISIFTKFTFGKTHFSQNSHFENHNLHKIHVSEELTFLKIHIYEISIFRKFRYLKITSFTRFTFWKAQFSHNSHFWNINFHKIHILKNNFS